MNRRHFLKTGLGAMWIAAGGCAVPSRTPGSNDHVVLVLIDQLRGDAIDRWAPRLKALAAEGVRFDRMRSAAPWTYPSVISMMSGLYPQQHGADGRLVGSNLTTFDPELPLLQRQLRDAGYRTAGFVTNPFLHEWNSFHVGFDFFDAHFVRNPGAVRPRPGQYGASSRMFSPSVNASVRKHYDRTLVRSPEFTYLHYMDVHGPWRSAPFSPGYEPSVRFIDKRIEEMHRFFLERYDGNVWFIVTSDHGYAPVDELELGYGRSWRKLKLSCHDFNLRIPCLFLPSRKIESARRLDGVCSNVDLTPTVLEIAGIPVRARLAGRSLLSLVRGDRKSQVDRAIYAKVSAFGGFSDAVVFGDRKLMRFFDVRTGKVRATRLFDLASDPEETRALATDEPSMTRLMADLSGIGGVVYATAAADAALSDDTRKHLEALGYLD